MITALKGSPQYSIDSDNIMTIQTTWMVIPDNGSDGMSAMDWLSFGNEVERWAGKSGDNYKMPKLKEGTREAFEYTEVSTFKVETVDWHCVDGRTHYEVSYTNVQNLSEMTMVGNVSVSSNENNERTKTIRYRLDMPSNAPTAIDAFILESGTTVTWAGAEYLIESSDYSAETATRYEISITAKDMSVMMIGKPHEEIDGFGQRTMDVTWRYSNEAYENWERPAEGSDASPYLGGIEGFLVQNVSIEPHGVLGYNIKISAVHVSRKFVTSTVRKTRGQGTEYSITYKSDKDNVDDFLNAINQEANDFGVDSSALISEVNVSEQSRDNFDITLTAKQGGRSSDTEIPIGKQVSASGTASVFVIEPRHGGWDIMVNGAGIYPINFPPTTMFAQSVNPTEWWNSIKDSGADVAWTESDILNAIKRGGTVGYDRISRVIDKDGNDITTNTSARQALSSLSAVRSIVFQGFVYAQPKMTESNNGKQTTRRNIYFKPWEAKNEAPLMLEKGDVSNYPKADGRDKPFARKYIHQEVPMMEFTVTHNYKGSMATVLRKDWDRYFKEAVDYIENSRYTSYRCTGLNPSEITDDNGTIWTSVTVTIQALRYCYWNPNYGSGGAYYVRQN